MILIVQVFVENIKPSIFCYFFRFVLRGQHSTQRSPDIPPPWTPLKAYLQKHQGVLKLAVRYNLTSVSWVYLVASCPKHFTQEASRRQPSKMPKLTKLALLMWRRSSYPLEEAYFCCVYCIQMSFNCLLFRAHDHR